MTNETELRERDVHVDDNAENFDSDRALSLIEERLLQALGHFQNEFELEISAGLSGPKFGMYGSFLPTHIDPPAVHSHREALNFGKPSSPQLKGAPSHLNPVSLVDPAEPAVLQRKDVVGDQNVLHVDEIASQDGSLLKNEATTSVSVKPTEQRSLKVRIKVGSCNPALQKDEIYSGLGLTSPSSTSNNSKDNGDPPVDSHDIPFDSPSCMLRDVCSGFVPGNRLLSPLNESLLCLKNKVAPLIMGRMASSSTVADDSSSFDSKVKPSSNPKRCTANRAVKKEELQKTRETVVSRGVKPVVCKNDPAVIKNKMVRFKRFEKKAGLKAARDVKPANKMGKPPLGRKNKLTRILINKSAFKDIVKVRNSYKDILCTDNEAIKAESVERSTTPAKVAMPRQTKAGPAAPPDNWVGCDRCEKWRLLPIDIEPNNLPDKWQCSMSTWLPGRNHCDVVEDETTRAVQKMNLQLISQNQGTLRCNGIRGNIGSSCSKNSSFNSAIMADKCERIKSRPPEVTSSSLIKTSRISLDVQQQNRQKRKFLSETNQPLLDEEGDVKRKRLKSKTGYDCDTKNLSVTSFLKEFASSQSQIALTALKKAEESKDYADSLKSSGCDDECNNAFFDSVLKFLCAASLLEACNADISKSKGVDTIDVYTTSAKLSKICAEEYEKRKEMAASVLAYKCMEVACMRIVYCKNSLTRQELQTDESPSSSASDVDNLNNQATLDKVLLSKRIMHHKNHVERRQANFTRLLDLTSDVSLAMEASMKSQDAYKSARAILEETQNKEMIVAVKRVVNFSFQDVRQFVRLVQNARDAVNHHGCKGDKRQ